MSGLADTLIQFIHANQNWAAPIILLLAFCESFAFISLLVPATVVILAISGFLGAAHVEFLPVYAGAVAGAFLGDWLAFEAALHFRSAIAAVWPLSKYPELLRRGFDLFGRWGIISSSSVASSAHCVPSYRSRPALRECPGPNFSLQILLRQSHGLRQS